jgi:hypothetical protein
MANDYCTLAEVQAAVPDSGLSSTDYDSLVTTLITRACRLIDTEARRKPGAFAISSSSSDNETRYYTGSGNDEQWVDEMAGAPSYVGISNTGGVQATDYDTVSSTDYFLYPDNAAYDYKPYRRIDLDSLNGAYSTFYAFRRGVKVTAPFGYSTTDNTPDDIKQAAIITTVRWFKRGQQGFQDAGAVPELGQMFYVKALDPDVAETLAHYWRLAI